MTAKKQKAAVKKVIEWKSDCDGWHDITTHYNYPDDAKERKQFLREMRMILKRYPEQKLFREVVVL
jgi:hypothetical protein